MKKCWRQSPEERPRFRGLVATLDKTLQTVAGYIELSMTLDRGGDQEEEEDWSGYEVVQPTIETPITAGVHFWAQNFLRIIIVFVWHFFVNVQVKKRLGLVRNQVMVQMWMPWKQVLLCPLLGTLPMDLELTQYCEKTVVATEHVY